MLTLTTPIILAIVLATILYVISAVICGFTALLGGHDYPYDAPLYPPSNTFYDTPLRYNGGAIMSTLVWLGVFLVALTPIINIALFLTDLPKVQKHRGYNSW